MNTFSIKKRDQRCWRPFVNVDILKLISWYVVFNYVFSSHICWEVHLKLASDKLIQVLESPGIHLSTSECMTAKLPIFTYILYMSCLAVPINNFNAGCRIALWLFGGGQPRKEHRGGCHARKPLMLENGFRIEFGSSIAIMVEISAFWL